MSATAVPLSPSSAPAPAPATPRPSGAPVGLLRSTVGRKALMAVTGLVLFGFVLAHMVGNLQVYLGAAAMNHYAEFLRSFLHGWGLWVARAGLLAAVVLHIWSATTLTLHSWEARPVKYKRWRAQEATYASRTMRWGGVILFLFVVYHLLHFTVGSAHPDFRPGDVSHNFVSGFRQPVVSGVYLVAMVALGLHLDHGVWSLLRTLGLSHPRYVRLARAAAAGFALIVTAGNVSFPLAVLTGVVR